jgi:Mg2+ and Co2+ transporter CorA
MVETIMKISKAKLNQIIKEETFDQMYFKNEDKFVKVITQAYYMIEEIEQNIYEEGYDPDEDLERVKALLGQHVR